MVGTEPYCHGGGSAVERERGYAVLYDKTSMTSQHGNLLLRYCTECQSAFSKFKLFMDLEGGLSGIIKQI